MKKYFFILLLAGCSSEPASIIGAWHGSYIGTDNIKFIELNITVTKSASAQYLYDVTGAYSFTAKGLYAGNIDSTVTILNKAITKGYLSHDQMSSPYWYITTDNFVLNFLMISVAPNLRTLRIRQVSGENWHFYSADLSNNSFVVAKK